MLLLIRTNVRLLFAARRFLVPVAICFVVRLTYFGSTLTVVCRLCARISRSVSGLPR